MVGKLVVVGMVRIKWVVGKLVVVGMVGTNKMMVGIEVRQSVKTSKP